MPTPIGAKYGSFEPEELDKLDKTANCVKLIIDTGWVKVKGEIIKLRKAKAFYVRFPDDVNHIDAVAEYISRTTHRKLSRDDLNADNAGHVVGAVIQLTDLRYIIGHSSVESQVKHSEEQLGEAEALVIEIKKKFELYAAARAA